MSKIARYTLFSLLALLTYMQSKAQEKQVCIAEINIIGKRDTQREYIMRELPIRESTCYPAEKIKELLALTEQRTFNSGLFWDVRLEEYWKNDTLLDVNIYVKEFLHWAFAAGISFPDRNFNVWWELRESLFDRLNFSLRTRYNNLTGKNNRITLITQVGYTQKLQLEYFSPYIDKKKHWGLLLDALVARQQEINYATQDNRQIFEIQGNLFLYQRIRGMAGLIYWPKLLWKHEMTLEYHYDIIDPYVKEQLNPNFFVSGLLQRYDAVQYMATYEKRDNIPYPLSGRYFRVGLRKEGILRVSDLNTLYLQTNYREYFKLAPKLSTEHIASFRLGLMRPEELPYNNIRALGWQNDFIRGYEVYMIDGLDFVYFKNSIRYKILDINPKTFDWIPFRRYRSLPLRIYTAANFDLGYVNNPFNFEGNSFANRWLYGGGLGLDFVGYNDMVVRIESSWNHLGELGVFLHYKFGIR